MLSLFLSAVLCLAIPARAAQQPPPSPDEVKAAVAELTEAFTKGKSPERIEALTKGSRVVDARVIEWVAKGLDDKDLKVREAAVEALRFMPHPDSLAALHALARRDKKLEKEPELLAKLYKAIGQHGNADSIELLADNPFGALDHKVIEARVLGLGNIRDPRSVEQLIALMRVAGRHKLQPFMATFRLALMRLTGVDQGLSQDLWMGWWNEHKDKLEVAKVAPPMPKDLQLRWDYYWGNEVQRERGKKRGDRGDDPEDSGGK
jgi:hypothetical protein